MGGVSRDVLIDSGSASTVISVHTGASTSGAKNWVTALQTFFGSESLKLKIQFHSEDSVAKTKIEVDYHFTVWQKRGRSLFGYSTDTDVGILHVGPAGTHGTGNCNTANEGILSATNRHGFSARNGEWGMRIVVDPKLFAWERPVCCMKVTKGFKDKGRD